MNEEVAGQRSAGGLEDRVGAGAFLCDGCVDGSRVRVTAGQEPDDNHLDVAWRVVVEDGVGERVGHHERQWIASGA
jgi:hypothetical protein